MTDLMERGLTIDKDKIAVVEMAPHFPIYSSLVGALKLLGQCRAKLLPLFRQVHLGALLIDHVVGARPHIGAVEHGLAQAAHIVLVDWLWPGEALGEDLWSL